jgi:hypothetical protein
MEIRNRRETKGGIKTISGQFQNNQAAKNRKPSIQQHKKQNGLGELNK